ncbi:hypothetical protein Tco_0031590 [Tanacetum coccineum]
MQHESCVEESYVKICIGGSWCEDADETEVKNVVVPFERERKASKACQSTFVQQPPTTQVKRKRRRIEKSVISFSRFFLIPILDLTCPGNAPLKTVIVPQDMLSLLHDKKNEMQWTFPWSDDGLKVSIKFLECLVGRGYCKRGWLSEDVRNFGLNICGTLGQTMLTGQCQVHICAI